MALAQIVIPALSTHTATVIFLHGLGDSGEGWRPTATLLGIKHPHVKWILPHARTHPITHFNGMALPAWFNVSLPRSAALTSTDPEAEILTSAALSIGAVIQQEILSGTPAERIIFGGFSQGGALSLLTGLTTEHKTGGVICLSGWLPIRSRVKDLLSPSAKDLPFFMAHGRADETVNCSYGVASYEFITGDLGLSKRTSETSPTDAVITLQLYDGLEHWTNPKELQDMSGWLSGIIPKLQDTVESSLLLV